MEFAWHTKWFLPPFNETMLLWYKNKVVIGYFEKGPCMRCTDPACFKPRFGQVNFPTCIRLNDINGWVMPSELKPYVGPTEVTIETKEDNNV